MNKGIIALLFCFTVGFSSLGWSETKVFQIGFTIPATATINTAKNSTNSSNQAAQTQQMVRGAKTMLVTSIVTL